MSSNLDLICDRLNYLKEEFGGISPPSEAILEGDSTSLFHVSPIDFFYPEEKANSENDDFADSEDEEWDDYLEAADEELVERAMGSFSVLPRQKGGKKGKPVYSQKHVRQVTSRSTSSSNCLIM